MYSHYLVAPIEVSLSLDLHWVTLSSPSQHRILKKYAYFSKLSLRIAEKPLICQKEIQCSSLSWSLHWVIQHHQPNLLSVLSTSLEKEEHPCFAMKLMCCFLSWRLGFVGFHIKRGVKETDKKVHASLDLPAIPSSFSYRGRKKCTTLSNKKAKLMHETAMIMIENINIYMENGYTALLNWKTIHGIEGVLTVRLNAGAIVTTFPAGELSFKDLSLSKNHLFQVLSAFNATWWGSWLVHTPIPSAFIFTRLVMLSRKAKEMGQLFFFSMGFITMRFALSPPNTQKVEKKEKLKAGLAL